MSNKNQKHQVESEAKFELLFNNMTEGVALHRLVFDEHGNPSNYVIEKVNPQYEKILRFNKGDIEGSLATIAYKTQKAPYLDEYSKVALTGQPYHFNTYFPPLSKHFSISVSPWGNNGFATIFSDVSEQNKAQEELQLKRTAFNAAISANIITNTNGIIVKVNNAFFKTWGYAKDAVVLGKHITYLLQDKNQALVITQSLDTTGEWRGNYVAQKQDGSTFIALALATTLKNNNGHHIGYQCSVIDVTDCKRAEEQSILLIKEKELLLKELHHRVTNNISAISNLLMLQAETISNPEAASILTDARNRLKSMGLLHKKLYKSENMQDCHVKEYLSLLIEEILVVFPNRKNIKVEKHLDDFILTQKVLFPLGIIINELLTNSMKHAFVDKDGALIKVSLTRDEKLVTLVIEDNGNGIPLEKTRESNGFGMTLISLLTDQLKGNLQIERENGTKFALNFELS